MTTQDDSPRHIIKQLGLSEAEIDIYLTLAQHGSLAIRDIMRLTKIKRPTAYYAIRQLSDKGLVNRSGTPGVERFQAGRPEQLQVLLKLRHRELEMLENKVKKIIPQLKQKKTPYEGIPAISFFEGETAMKQAISETLYCKDGHIDSIVPANNFFWQIDQSFSSKYIEERVMRKITTRNLWEVALRPEIMLESFKGLSEVRILPDAMHKQFKTTIFLFDNQTMYISSQKSGYVLVVRSQEHHDTMKAMFNGLWDSSKKITFGE